MKRLLLSLAVLLAPGLVFAASPDDLEKLLPTLSLESLSPEQRETLANVLATEFSYCGSPSTLATSLRERKSCRHAPRMAGLAARMAAAGMVGPEISKALSEYYASFDKAKRARLNVKDFGPPLGDPKAPVTIVEFSDFTCPFCQMLRPVVEKFVKAHEGRVKLIFKPFPISSHESAAEAAEAVEWARDKGLFWKMHDLVFSYPDEVTPEGLSARAEQIGGDGADCRKAMDSHRNKARIEGSQTEARASGLTSTPTLYFNGRRYTLPDLSPVGLEFTLEDEEEWTKGEGWVKD